MLSGYVLPLLVDAMLLLVSSEPSIGVGGCDDDEPPPPQPASARPSNVKLADSKTSRLVDDVCFDADFLTAGNFKRNYSDRTGSWTLDSSSESSPRRRGGQMLITLDLPNVGTLTILPQSTRFASEEST